MRCIKVLLSIALTFPSFAWAVGTNTPAANEPQPVRVLMSSAIPFIKASSGTMGNNGAVSAMTALPRTFSGGAYLWLPAGAIAAGVPASASWYWFVGSSTTAGTVYNCTYTSGPPTVCTNTAFSTTGPGAFTGDTGTITAASVTVPANLMGVNGRVEYMLNWSENNSGGSKTATAKLGSLTVFTHALTTQTSEMAMAVAANRGVTNIQQISELLATSAGGVFGGTTSATDGTQDTTTALAAAFTLTTAVATDHAVLENYRVIVYPQN